MASCESTGRELSFEWSHHRISSIDSKVRVTLQNPSNTGSERGKTKGACDINKGPWHLVETQMEVYGYVLRQSSYLLLSRRKNYL